MPRNIYLHNEITILLMPILPPPSIDRGDIIKNQVKIEKQQPMVNTKRAIVELKWSRRIYKPTIPNDYMVYLQEFKFNVINGTNLISF